MTIAVDIDLHRIHAWCSDCGQVCTSEPFLAPVYEHYNQHLGASRTSVYPKVLVEVASPVSTQRTNMASKAVNYNLMKWAIFNIATANDANRDLEGHVLVAPSDKWTNGYDKKKRQLIAKATAKNGDLRDCEAMIFMYNLDPTKWITFDQYVLAL